MKHTLVVILLVGGMLAGCSSAYDAGSASRSGAYKPGYASFDVECQPLMSGDRSGVQMYLRILAPTLAWLKVDAAFEAQVMVQARILRDEDGSQVTEIAWPETLRVATSTETQEHAPFRSSRQVLLEPGRYRCAVSLEDRGTRKSGERLVMAIVPRVQEGQPTLGGIVLARREREGTLEPVIGFHVPVTRDTLFARVPVLNVPAGTPVEVHFSICRFVADTARAGLPYLFMPAFPAMEGNRIFPHRIDTVYTIRETRKLLQGGYVLDDVLPPLERGVYQLALYVWGPGQEPTEASAAGAIKYFVVVGPSFPRPVLLKDLVEASEYIAKRNEQPALDTLTTPQGLRTAFDRFWLSLVPDTRRATAVMRAYYNRVQEASRMFSSTKEGWRTDRGMVYIVFGPPDRVDKRSDVETWSYTLPGSNIGIIFEFRRVFFMQASLTIEDYILRRNIQYEEPWEHMVKKWRDGEIF